MADSSSLPLSTTPRSRVVRSLARAAERPCARPSCPAPARATLSFAYATAEAHLDRLSDAADPQRYDLCARHAARTEPPRGWDLVDRRPDEDRVELDPPPITRRELGSDATVAVLAAALRAVPEPPRHTPEVAAPVASPPVASPPVASPPVASPPVASDEGSTRRRTVVDTLLSPPAGTPAAPVAAPPAPLRTPRRVPAAGDRGPATDW
jgi:hypothetical protein